MQSLPQNPGTPACCNTQWASDNTHMATVKVTFVTLSTFANQQWQQGAMMRTFCLHTENLPQLYNANKR